MLGLNQTIVFALFMVIIGAFIGTEDLGQYILKALSDKKGAGIGLTLGLCVAFIGLIFGALLPPLVPPRGGDRPVDCCPLPPGCTGAHQLCYRLDPARRGA